MTVVTMVWVQEHVHEVRNATKAVLSYLAFKAHYDDGTAAYTPQRNTAGKAAIGTIAGACGLSEKTVQRSIDQLLDLGLLEPGQQTFSAINPKTGEPVRQNYQTVVWNVICKESNLPTEPFEDRNASKVRAAMKRADKAKAKMPSPEPEGGEDDGREDKMSGFSDERQPEETKAKMSPLENVENKPVSSNLPKMSPLERQGGEGDGSEDKMSKNLDKMSPNNTLKYNYPSLPTGELPASGKRPGMEDGNNTTTGGDSDAATVMDHLASVRSKLSLTTTEPTKRDLSKIGNLVSRVVKARDGDRAASLALILAVIDWLPANTFWLRRVDSARRLGRHCFYAFFMRHDGKLFCRIRGNLFRIKTDANIIHVEHAGKIQRAEYVGKPFAPIDDFIRQGISRFVDESEIPDLFVAKKPHTGFRNGALFPFRSVEYRHGIILLFCKRVSAVRRRDLHSAGEKFLPHFADAGERIFHMAMSFVARTAADIIVRMILHQRYFNSSAG